MINFKQGSITSDATGETKDIIVKAVAPNTLKDALIGGGLVLMGIAYLTVTAFRNGSKALESAEFKTLNDLGLITSCVPVEKAAEVIEDITQ